jgi:eukaryotic-like serine/threonine-protein kinase
MADLPHRTIGRYEIRKEIGRGMMGVVYEALDPALARTIALKTIQLSFSVGEDDLEVFEQRFFAEARIAARLSHPGIVVVHDVGRDTETGTLFIAMERLRGRTLADIISEGVVLDWRVAFSIVVRIAEALHHAHAQGVVHRDLKPANIMLLPSGEPKILDFGIAKVETARTRLTSDGQFFGTPLYMSPEQALGRDLDPRSDLFSLGAVAYNLLTGHAAFAADSIPAIMQRVIEDEPVPPSHFVLDLPLGVDSIIARTLAKEPAHRYPDGQGLAEDIKEILGGRSPHEHVLAVPPKDLFETLAVEPPEPRGEPEPQMGLVGVATRPGGDLADELETLVSGLIPLPDASSPPPAAEAIASPGASRWFVVLALGLTGVLVALGLTAYFLWTNVTPRSTPPTLARTSSPSPPVAPTPSPSAPVDAPLAPVPAAALALDFEYPLEDGRLRVWIDGRLSLNQDLTGRLAKNVVGIKIHKGSLEKTLGVRPGRHEVRVQVTWDDNVKEETLNTTFKAGGTRHLEIRLGRIRKNLSVEWK